MQSNTKKFTFSSQKTGRAEEKSKLADSLESIDLPENRGYFDSSYSKGEYRDET